MYVVKLDNEVIKYMGKLPKIIRKRIFNKLYSAKENPFHFFERLTGKQCYKLRVGKYRIIADIDQENDTISVRYIELRKKVYDKLWKFRDEEQIL